ncbi:MAG: tetratricopeptide repeat protein [Mariniblastus sp.]
MKNRLLLGRLLFYDGKVKEAAGHASAIVAQKKVSAPTLEESAKTLLKSCETKSHDWEALATRPFYKDVCKLGLLAVYYRNAGNQEKFESTIQEILKDNKPSYNRGEALMLSRQWDKAIENFSENSLHRFVHLSQLLGKHESALKLIGLENPNGRSAAWYQESLLAVESLALPTMEKRSMRRPSIKILPRRKDKDSKPDDGDEKIKPAILVDLPDYQFEKTKREQLLLAVQVADLLCEIGEDEEAISLLTAIGKTEFSKQDHQTCFPRILRVERDRELYSQLEKHLVEYLQKYEMHEKAWREVLPKEGVAGAASAAVVWLKVLSEREKTQKSEINVEHVRRVVRLYSTNRFPFISEPELESLAKKFVTSVHVTKSPADNLTHLARLCNHHGHSEMALKYFKSALSFKSSYSNRLNVADQYRRMEQWEDARKAYTKTVISNPESVTARMLAGYCDIQAGKATLAQLDGESDPAPRLESNNNVKAAKKMIQRGEEAMRWADLSLLYDTSRRYALSNDFNTRGLEDLRVEQLHRIVDFQNARPIYFVAGGSLAFNDETMPLDERLFLVSIGQACINHPSSWYEFMDGYTAAGSNNELLRTQYRIEQNNISGALDAARDCHNASPYDVKKAFELVEAFEKAGETDAADEVFKNYFDFMEASTKQYPKSFFFHHCLASLCLMCERELEEGLKFAKLAVTMPCKQAAVHLTLAQLHFALGNKSKANDALKVAIELTPNSKEVNEAKKKFAGQGSAESQD